ncbi:MAG: alpha/beta hydrolase family protein [Solirubrobacteraceae bacterium]
MAGRDVQALLAELAALVKAAGVKPSVHAYGPAADQRCDLLLPDRSRGARHFPVAVLLHGGFWRARFTRSTLEALAVDLGARGWASWNVEYRRVGSEGGPERTLADVNAAIARLGSLDAPIDLRRTVLIGHSAGGQLALCAAAGPQPVAGVVSLAGVCDLTAAARDAIGEDATVQFMGGTPEQRPAQYALADPLGRVPASAPVLLVHGDADRRVPVDHSRGYADAAVRAGGDCELVEISGADHFDLIDPRTLAWTAVTDRLPRLALA